MWRLQRSVRVFIGLAVMACGLLASTVALVGAQSAPPKPGASGPPAKPATADPVTGLTPGPEYIIGPDDVLTITFWRDKDLTGDVTVRPDGRISLPVVNELQASGLTPEQLRVMVTEAAKRFLNDEPVVSVVVKQVNSRKVYITGLVNKPGPYPLSDHMTVIQLIAVAGGLLEFADKQNIVILRATEKRPDGSPWSFVFNYDDVSHRRNLKTNIELKPGDQVIVP